MYFKDHPPPHIHIIKNEQNIVFSIQGEHLHVITKELNVNKLRAIINRNEVYIKNKRNIVFYIQGKHLYRIIKEINVNNLSEIINRNLVLLESNWQQMKGAGELKKLK